MGQFSGKKMTEKEIDEQLQRATARLREIRESSGLDQKQFAELFSIEQSTYNRYENGGIKKMPYDFIDAICEKFGINPAWVLGFKKVDKYTNPVSSEKTKRLPILGNIAAGIPILAQEDLLGYDFVPENFNADFCLKVKGDSMVNVRILDGDTVYIRQQPDVENGEIAAVLIDGEAATLKRVYKLDGSIILRAENHNYSDIIFSKKDMKEVQILGKAIFFKSEVR